MSFIYSFGGVKSTLILHTNISAVTSPVGRSGERVEVKNLAVGIGNNVAAEAGVVALYMRGGSLKER